MSLSKEQEQLLVKIIELSGQKQMDPFSLLETMAITSIKYIAANTDVDPAFHQKQSAELGQRLLEMLLKYKDKKQANGWVELFAVAASMNYSGEKYRKLYARIKNEIANYDAFDTQTTILSQGLSREN